MLCLSPVVCEQYSLDGSFSLSLHPRVFLNILFLLVFRHLLLLFLCRKLFIFPSSQSFYINVYLYTSAFYLNPFSYLALFLRFHRKYEDIKLSWQQIFRILSLHYRSLIMLNVCSFKIQHSDILFPFLHLCKIFGSFYITCYQRFTRIFELILHTK